MTIKIFVDGACEPINPGGIATYGFVIYRDGDKIAENAGVVDSQDTSNNVAEYSAAIEAFKWMLANELYDERIILRSDSELLINQLNGLYAVRARRVRPLYGELQRLIGEIKRSISQRRLPNIVFEWIPREENEEADALSKRAYRDFCAENPEVLKRYANHLATDKQRELMLKLRIPVFDGISKRMASRLIHMRLVELKLKKRRETKGNN